MHQRYDATRHQAVVELLCLHDLRDDSAKAFSLVQNQGGDFLAQLLLPRVADQAVRSALNAHRNAEERRPI